MGFKSNKQRGYVMAKLKGAFIEPKEVDLDKYMTREEFRQQQREQNQEFDYNNYDIGTKEGRRQARIDFFVKKRGMQQEEAEQYVDTHHLGSM